MIDQNCRSRSKDEQFHCWGEITISWLNGVSYFVIGTFVLPLINNIMLFFIKRIKDEVKL